MSSLLIKCKKFCKALENNCKSRDKISKNLDISVNNFNGELQKHQDVRIKKKYIFYLINFVF